MAHPLNACVASQTTVEYISKVVALVTEPCLSPCLCLPHRGLKQGAGAQEMAYMEDGGAVDPKMDHVGNGHDPAIAPVTTH
jgi:hypothetical protein